MLTAARSALVKAQLYATLINAYGRAGLPEEAQRVFDQLQREERLVDAPLLESLRDDGASDRGGSFCAIGVI